MTSENKTLEIQTGLDTEESEQNELGNFCWMPFQHLCIGNEGTARICCMSSSLVTDNGAPMSLYRHSFEQIWNSAFMRDIRRKMLNGERVSECDVCFMNEAQTGTSYRTFAGLTSMRDKPLDIPSLRRESIENNYTIDSAPEYIKLELGNLCNLKCRMCYSATSSEIERDPIHSWWSGGAEGMHPFWDGDRLLIGPDWRIGVNRLGVYDRENLGDDWIVWSNGAAQFELPMNGIGQLGTLEIRISEKPKIDRTFRVLVNGEARLEARACGEKTSWSINLAGLAPRAQLKIEILSETAFNSQTQRSEGLPLKELVLQKFVSTKASGAKQVLNSRFPKPGIWYRSDEIVFGETFADPQSLRRLYITGGEPLVEKRFEKIIDYLIENGAADKIDFELTTNATVFNECVLRKLSKFKTVNLTISLDGTGAVQEYIRYPSRWSTVRENVYRLRSCGFTYVTAIPVVQAYNMLALADICYFAREAGIGISLMNVLQQPTWLQMSVMPQAVHRLAAERLRGVVKSREAEGADFLNGQLLSLIKSLESFNGPVDHTSLHTFNLFTNDLDISRGQRFRTSLPELYDLIIESGYKWTEETLRANRGHQRRPARERIHEWV